MTPSTMLSLILVAALASAAPAEEAKDAAPKLPYVYTHWKQFTVADGLPNDRILAVKVDGPRVWVGTDGGLAEIDKASGKVARTWREKDGLPFRVVTAIDVDPKTGDVWLGFFGGGLARLSGGRFDHWHQLNSGLVSDLVYGIAVENDHVWAATTAGASRLDTVKGEWTVFTETNAPMEEICVRSVAYDGKDAVHLGLWGGGLLEYDIRTGRWKKRLGPLGDDGIGHAIVSGVSPAEGIVWIATHFGGARYDGRHWRDYVEHEGGLPSDFGNSVRGRGAQEALYCSDQGLGIVADAPAEAAAWVSYTRDAVSGRGRATVTVGGRRIGDVEMPVGVPHAFVIAADVDGNDIWVGTAKGLGWGIGEGYYAGTRERPLYAYGRPAPPEWSAPAAAVAGAFGAPAVETGVRPTSDRRLDDSPLDGPKLDSVKVGFIGPIRAAVSVTAGGKSHEEALREPMLQGARLAVEEWNARGGYSKRKLPFELVVTSDNRLWGGSGNEVVKQAYQDGVWGMLSTIDGTSGHIAVGVALKAELPLVNAGDTDPSLTEANVPWVARVIGDDRQQGRLLTDYWYRTLGLKRIAIIRSSNRYGRLGVRELRDSARRLEQPIPIEVAYRVGQTDFRRELEQVQDANPDAVVHWGDAVEGALVLNTMRAMGMSQPFFGCNRTVSEEFVKRAGKNAEGVVAAFPWNPESKDPKLELFRKAYRARFGMEVETYAAHAYDGMNLMLWAIAAAGLDRAKIRDVIAHLPHPWLGVTGEIVLSARLDDVGDTYLAAYHGGSWHYASRTDLGIPPDGVAPR